MFSALPFVERIHQSYDWNFVVLTPWPFRPKEYCYLCLSVRPSVRKLYLVRTITRHRFDLESPPNLHQICIMGYSHLVLKWRSLTLTFNVILAILTQNSRNSVSLCHNSSQIWARIAKFMPKMHHEILLVGIENGGYWPWPLRLFWLKIPGNLACPLDNL